jgi:hypothetical protein
VGDIVLKNIDENLIEAINAEAAVSGRTMNEVAESALLRGLLAVPSIRLAVADRIRAMTPVKLGDESTRVIRALRDGG